MDFNVQNNVSTGQNKGHIVYDPSILPIGTKVFRKIPKRENDLTQGTTYDN